MLQKIKNAFKPLALKLFYAYKKKFLQVPVPPKKVSKFIWGKAQYHSIPDIPKFVWIYWHDENIPEISRLCIRKIKALNPDYEVHVLNQKTIGNYVPDLLSFTDLHPDLPLANYSDLVRLSLLEKYGGFYLDASVILNVPLDYFVTLNKESGSELVLFNLASITNTNNKYPMTETWFLGAVPDSKFIKDWKEEFYKCITSIHPKQYYVGNPDYLQYVQRIPHALRTYLLVFISSQVVMQQDDSYKLLFLRSEESAYLYVKSVFWNFEIANDLIANIKQPLKLPLLIKLTNEGRRLANDSLIKKSYAPFSILGNLAKLETTNKFN